MQLPHLSVKIHSTTHGNCTNVDFNGQKFGALEMDYKINDEQHIQQTQYAKITKNDYILTFLLKYMTNDEKIQLDNIMWTVTFEWWLSFYCIWSHY